MNTSSGSAAYLVPGLTRRNLIVILVAGALIFGVFHFLHKSRASTPKHPVPALALATCRPAKTAGSIGRKAVCAHRVNRQVKHAPVRGKHARVAAAHRRGARHAKPAQARHLTPWQRWHAATVRHDAARIKQYAVALAPVLDAARHVFDRTAWTVASSPTMSDVGSACDNLGARVAILITQVDGVPHPSAGWTNVGVLHHRIMGIYHRMSGSLIACSTAADNEDQTAVSTSAGDITRYDSALRRVDDYVHWIVRRK